MNLGGSKKPPKAPDPAVVSQAQTQSNQDTASYNASLNRQNTYTPFGSQTFTQNGTDSATGAPRWDENITLDPRLQGSLDSQLNQNQQLNQTGDAIMDRIRSNYSTGMDTSGVPALRDAPTMGAYQSQIDTNNLPALYGSDDLLGARQQTQDALYNRQAGYLDPQWQQRENKFRSRMANQGVVEGSEAWRTALDDENRARTFEYGQARDQAITGGGEEMSRLAGIASGNRAQTFGERASMADFYNGATGAGNADALRGAAFGNQARTQGMNEAQTLRNQPINELAAIRNAAPVEIPQFNPPPSVSVAPTSTADNVWRGYQGQLDIYNAGQSGSNAMMGGLANMGGQLGSAWIARSDKRLKKDVTKRGKLPDGTNLYDYTMKDTGQRQTGVMAQEVEKKDPKAVMTGKDGYKRVNYARVMARAMAG
jgi:hypothetical protein